MEPVIEHFLRDEAGATAIEYALLGSLIAVTIIGSVATVGTNLKDFYTRVADCVSSAVSGGQLNC